MLLLMCRRLQMKFFENKTVDDLNKVKKVRDGGGIVKQSSHTTGIDLKFMRISLNEGQGYPFQERQAALQDIGKIICTMDEKLALLKKFKTDEITLLNRQEPPLTKSGALATVNAKIRSIERQIDPELDRIPAHLCRRLF